MKINSGLYITRIKQIHSRLLNKLISDRNITEFNGEQGRILHILWDKKEMSNKEISKETGLAMSSLTTMLERMENKGLIERCIDKNDKRKILVSLTEKSKKLEKDYIEITKEMTNYTYRAKHKINDKEIELFENILKKIMENVEYIENNMISK